MHATLLLLLLLHVWTGAALVRCRNVAGGRARWRLAFGDSAFTWYGGCTYAPSVVCGTAGGLVKGLGEVGWIDRSIRGGAGWRWSR